MTCSNDAQPLDPLEQCTVCKGPGGRHISSVMNSARTTSTSSLTQEPSTSGALGRVRAEVMPWLVAQATKFAHPDKQVLVTLTREERASLGWLSLPEAEAAIRQLMQAYANAMSKSVSFCAYPNDAAGEQR